MTRHQIAAGGIRAEVDSVLNRFTLYHEGRGHRLLIAPQTSLFVPVTAGGMTVNWSLRHIEETEKELRFFFDLDDAQHEPVIGQYILTLRSQEDHMEMSSAFTAARDCELNRLELFPAETGVNLYDLVNYRNRHHTPQTWPELNFGETIDTTTYSNDWQFAPHSALYILRRNEESLFVGAKNLTSSFGMPLAAEDFVLKRWDLDYGAPGAGLALKAGETFQSPVFALFAEEGKEVRQVLDRYTDILVREGRIPDPRAKKRFAWHRQNLYCTWLDQGYRSLAAIPTQLSEQSVTGGLDDASAVLDEAQVRRALDVIALERLPFTTILIDVGWQKISGEWVPHPERFPNLRGLVDEIHAKGMKVILWWNWAELYDDAYADSAHLIGGGKRNRHGRRMRDYSNPVTQEEYLQPLFRKFFSSEADCYDIDGIKTDFLADKVHDDMPVHNPSWRGEDTYFYEVFRLFYTMMKSYKEDACHIGCSGHPYLSDFIDINRTYDIFSSNMLEHCERGRMLAATSPGTPVAFDFHCYVENLEGYFRTAKEEECSVQIGNILGMKKDFFSPWEPADSDYYDILRHGLEMLAEKYGIAAQSDEERPGN